MDARTLALILNGEVVGRDRVLAPGSGHSQKDRSLSIRLDPAAPDGFLAYSFAGDDWRACRDHIRAAIGLGTLDEKSRRTLPHPPRMRVTGVTASTTTASALALWNRATDAHGTIAETYLAGRKLVLPLGASVIRHAGDTERRGETMLALMRNVLTDAPVAVHRTYLTEDGIKIHRKFLGPTRGAAIKLMPASDTLTVAEGLETAPAASGAEMKSVWAMGSAGAIALLPVLPTVATLVILAENDGGASEKAISACAHRWCRGTGKRVFVVTPAADKDFADIWLRAGAGWRDYVSVERVRP